MSADQAPSLSPAVLQLWRDAPWASTEATAAIALAAVRLGLDARNIDHWKIAEQTLIHETGERR